MGVPRMRKMSVKMIMVVLSIVIAVTGVIGYINYKDAEKITLSILKDNHYSELNNIREYYFDKLISDMEHIVNTWSESPQIKSYRKPEGSPKIVASQPEDFTEISNQWKGLTASIRDISWIYYALESDGSIYITPVDPTMPEDYDAREKSWYQGTVSRQGEIFWTEPYLDAGASNKVLQTVSKAVYDGGVLQGVVGLDIELQKFTQIIENLSFSKNATLFLINDNNAILAHNSSDSDFYKTHFLDTLNAVSGTEIQRLDSRAFAVSWMPVELNNWKLVAITETNVYQELAVTRLKMVGTITLASLVGVLLAYILVTRLLRPLNSLKQLTTVVGSGDFSVRSHVTSRDEVSELSNGFNQMLEKIEDLMLDQEDNYFNTVKALANAIEASDEYTRGHCDRVGRLSLKIAEYLGLSTERIRHLEYACVLHDVGKIGIRESVLNKPGRLTEMEYEEIKQHPRIGYEIIKDIPFLKDAANILLQHHERIDGKGYPNRLKGSELLLEAKILAAADTYDAMTSFRVYRTIPLTDQQVKAELEQAKGTQLDAQVIEALLAIL